MQVKAQCIKDVGGTKYLKKGHHYTIVAVKGDKKILFVQISGCPFWWHVSRFKDVK